MFRHPKLQSNSDQKNNNNKKKNLSNYNRDLTWPVWALIGVNGKMNVTVAWGVNEHYNVSNIAIMCHGNDYQNQEKA